MVNIDIITQTYFFFSLKMNALAYDTELHYH